MVIETSLQLHLKRIVSTKTKMLNILHYCALILMNLFSDITQVLHSNRILYKPTRLYWINRTFQFAELVLGLRGVKTELSRKFSSHGSANGEPNMSLLVDQGLKVPTQCNQLSTLNWKRALTFQCKQTVLNGHVVNHKFVIQKGKLHHEKEYVSSISENKIQRTILILIMGPCQLSIKWLMNLQQKKLLYSILFPFGNKILWMKITGLCFYLS